MGIATKTEKEVEESSAKSITTPTIPPLSYRPPSYPNIKNNQRKLESSDDQFTVRASAKSGFKLSSSSFKSHNSAKRLEVGERFFK